MSAPAPHGPAPKTSGFAIASLLFGILPAPILAWAFGFVAWRQIARSGGALGGRGLAVAGIALGFLWLAVAGVVVALVLSGVFDEDVNADRYTGEEAEVAAVIDRFEQASEDDRNDVICNDIFTPNFEQLVASGVGKTCEEFYAEDNGLMQLEITITRLDLSGSTATVAVEEGSDPLQMTLVDDGTGWRIDDIVEL